MHCCPHALLRCINSDHLYMLLEYLPGGELFSLLYEEWSPLTGGDGGMPEPAARFYASCVVLSLEYLHGQDTAYRDLKMENLVLDKLGYAKLVDLGFCKILPGDTRTFTKCGSPDYMAPESHFGKAHGRPVDLWAFGVMLFELLTGTTPFFDKNRANIVRNAINIRINWPEGFSTKHSAAHDLIKKLIKVDPFERLGTNKDSSPAWNQIKQHPFFAETDWDAMAAQRCATPFVPEMEDAFDAQNFQEFSGSDDEEESQPYADDGSGAFDGF